MSLKSSINSSGSNNEKTKSTSLRAKSVPIIMETDSTKVKMQQQQAKKMSLSHKSAPPGLEPELPITSDPRLLDQMQIFIINLVSHTVSPTSSVRRKSQQDTSSNNSSSSSSGGGGGGGTSTLMRPIGLLLCNDIVCEEITSESRSHFLVIRPPIIPKDSDIEYLIFKKNFNIIHFENRTNEQKNLIEFRLNGLHHWLVSSPCKFLFNGTIRLYIHSQLIPEIILNLKEIVIPYNSRVFLNASTIRTTVEVYTKNRELIKEIFYRHDRRRIGLYFGAGKKQPRIKPSVSLATGVKDTIIYYDDKIQRKKPVAIVQGFLDLISQEKIAEIENLNKFKPSELMEMREDADIFIPTQQDHRYHGETERDYKEFILDHGSVIKMKFIAEQNYVFNLKSKCKFSLPKNTILIFAGYVGIIKNDDIRHAKVISGDNKFAVKYDCFVFIGDHYLFLLNVRPAGGANSIGISGRDTKSSRPAKMSSTPAKSSRQAKSSAPAKSSRPARSKAGGK